MIGTWSVACVQCKTLLRVEMDQAPETDFTAQCSKCRNAIIIRAATVKAAMVRPASSGQRVSEAAGFWEPAGGARASSKDDAKDAPFVPFQTRDVTGAILAMNAEDAPPLEEEPARRPITRGGSRAVPSNAPRTTPRPPPVPGRELPSPKVMAGIGGGVLVLLIVLVALLIHSRHLPSEGQSSSIPSTVETDSTVRADIAAIAAKYPGQGGRSSDLFSEGTALLRGDTSAEILEAAEKFRRALAADPRNPESLAALAMALNFLPRSERGGLGVTQANQWADYVQRMQPASLFGQDARAVLLASIDQQAEGLRIAHAQTEIHPGESLAWFVEAWILRRREPAASVAGFQRALSIEPGFRAAQTELASAELATGHLKAAQDALDARFAAGNVSGSAEREAADLAAMLGEFTAARTHFTQAVALEAKDVDLRLDSGWFEARNGGTASARDSARQVLEVDRPAQDASDIQAADAHLLLSEVLRREGNAKEAESEAKEALRVHPAKSRAQYALGLARFAAADPLAVDAFREASRLEPARATPLNALGFAQLQAGRIEEAIAAWQAAIAADPDDARAHLGLAIAFADADLPSKSLEEFAKLTEAVHPLAPYLHEEDPLFPEPPLDAAAAIAALRKVEEVDPNRDFRYRVWEGEILCLAGKVAEGLPKMTGPKLDPAMSASVAGWELVGGRTADALRLTARAESEHELATRAWALRASKTPGDERAFDAALASDPHDPYAALGKAQALLAHGKKTEALPFIEKAKARLGATPAIERAVLAAGE